MPFDASVNASSSPSKTKGTCIVPGSTSTLQVSTTGEDCEKLLHRCIDGDYAQLPAFASKVWQWFAETPHVADPAIMAQHVGQKAAFLLLSMNTVAKRASPPAYRAAETPLDVAILFCAGRFVDQPYLWGACVAWASMRMLSAMNMLAAVKRVQPLPECIVFAYAYFSMEQAPLLCTLHAIAWHMVWLCSAGLRDGLSHILRSCSMYS